MAETARLTLDLEESPYIGWMGAGSIGSAGVANGALLPATGDRAIFLWPNSNGTYSCQLVDALAVDAEADTGVSGGVGPVQTFVSSEAWPSGSATYRALAPMKFQAARLSSAADGDRYVIGEGGYAWATSADYIDTEPVITRLLLVRVPATGAPVVEDVATFEGMVRRNAAGAPVFTRNWIRVAGDGPTLGHVLCARQGPDGTVVHTVSHSGGQLVIGAERQLDTDFVGPVTNPGGTDLDPNTGEQEPILAQQEFYFRVPEGFGVGTDYSVLALRFADGAILTGTGAPRYVATTLATGTVLIGALTSGSQAATLAGLPQAELKTISNSTGQAISAAPPQDLTLRSGTGAAINGQGYWSEIDGSLLDGSTFYASAVRSDDQFVVAELSVSPGSVVATEVLEVSSIYGEAPVISTNLGPAIFNPTNIVETFQTPDEGLHQLLVDPFGIAPHDMRQNFSPRHVTGRVSGIDFLRNGSMVAGETGIFTAMPVDDRNEPSAVWIGFLGDFPPVPLVLDLELKGTGRFFKTARFG